MQSTYSWQLIFVEASSSNFLKTKTKSDGSHDKNYGIPSRRFPDVNDNDKMPSKRFTAVLVPATAGNAS